LRFYQRSKDKERKAAELEARLAQAKLQALHMQLQPHFLFNTLNAISMLVHKDPHAADEMIANLSDLLRASLNTRSPEITLSQEMELVDKYLAIQQVRFADRLTIRKNLEAGALQQRVPALILQPLIENAVKHGLEPKPGPGKLEIHAAVQDGCLRIRVEDDGVGTANQGSENHGIGLANTRDRLRELYGPEARLVLTNCSPGGFSAQIIIPESSRKSAGTPS
jgi:sensor histidine kinase YesM